MIRELKWADKDQLVSNYYSYYEEVKENTDLGLIFFRETPSEESELKWFCGLYDELLRGDAVAVVAEVDGTVAGICDIHRLRPGSEVDHIGNLGIAIARDYRSRGLGRGLMNEAIRLSRGKFKKIILSVFSTNTNAISLYSKIGFIEYGRIPGGVNRNGRMIDEIMMYYDL